MKIELEIPEGFEIDLKKSTPTNIVMRKKEKKPEKPKEKEWKNFGTVRGYYLDENGDLQDYGGAPAIQINRNTWPTRELAEAALALCQLLQWRNKVWDGWVPDWTDNGEYKSVITFVHGRVRIGSNDVVQQVLAFKDTATAEQFLYDHRSLIETAKPLL